MKTANCYVSHNSEVLDFVLRSNEIFGCSVYFETDKPEVAYLILYACQHIMSDIMVIWTGSMIFDTIPDNTMIVLENNGFLEVLKRSEWLCKANED